MLAQDLLKEADGGDVAKQFAAGMAFHLGQGDFEQSNEDALKYRLRRMYMHNYEPIFHAVMGLNSPEMC